LGGKAPGVIIKPLHLSRANLASWRDLAKKTAANGIENRGTKPLLELRRQKKQPRRTV
jgi:hypothetical protein